MATASQFISDVSKLEEVGNIQQESSMELTDSTIVSDIHSNIEQDTVLPKERAEGPISGGKNTGRKRTSSASKRPAGVSGTGSNLDIRQYLSEVNMPVGGTIRIPGFVSVSNPKWRHRLKYRPKRTPLFRRQQPIRAQHGGCFVLCFRNIFLGQC